MSRTMLLRSAAVCVPLSLVLSVSVSGAAPVERTPMTSAAEQQMSGPPPKVDMSGKEVPPNAPMPERVTSHGQLMTGIRGTPARRLGGKEAGLPRGVLNVVTGIGAEAGAALSAHPDVDFISFTGSPEVGTRVQKAAADHHAGVTLELGGKSPQIVFADADLEAALPIIINAIIVNSGQTCVAGSRLLVEESAIGRISEMFAHRFNQLVAGSHEGDYDLGPLINARQHRRVCNMIAAARNENVPLLGEGRIAAGSPGGGFYVAPALFGPVPRDNALAQREVFGPVLSLLPFKDEADAIALANDTPYGLAAAVWTRDGSRALRIAREVRAGQVFINAYGAGGGVELPFGGFKHSGHGREKGIQALEEFSATKTIIIHHG